MSSTILHDGKPLSSHGYPRPFDKEFHGKPLEIYNGRPGLYSYKPEQVSSSLIEYIQHLHNPDEMETEQKENHSQGLGLQQWKSLESGEHKNLGIGELLRLYAKCFDLLFFGGLLKGFYRISFLDSTIMPPFTWGQCCSGWKFKHGFEIEIRISNMRHIESFQVLDEPAQLRKLLGTLAHEMVHAVFQLYCCRTCDPCIVKESRKVGPSGHSVLWQELAISVEDTLNKCPLFTGGGAFDLNRSYSFFREFNGDEDCDCNVYLQDSLTQRQLGNLRLSARTNGKIEAQIRDRDFKRRQEARKKAKPSEAVVLKGRVSKANSIGPRH
ncbi:hypothetical protein O988_02622 [Pseudogymnoascus sp. VKM F-3808]|nr:hypothetical protein O988_02622 [Pseudogymnoascus sp. VKM F-3808]